MSNEMSNQTIAQLFGVAIALVSLWYFYGGGIEQQVAEDSIRQYNIAVESGNSTDAYVQAGIVAAAYLQANDKENYQKWSKIADNWGN